MNQLVWSLKLRHLFDDVIARHPKEKNVKIFYDSDFCFYVDPTDSVYSGSILRNGFDLAVVFLASGKKHAFYAKCGEYIFVYFEDNEMAAVKRAENDYQNNKLLAIDGKSKSVDGSENSDDKTLLKKIQELETRISKLEAENKNMHDMNMQKMSDKALEEIIGIKTKKKVSKPYEG